MGTRVRRGIPAVLAVAALVLSACGEATDEPPDSTSTAQPEPTTPEPTTPEPTPPEPTPHHGAGILTVEPTCVEIGGGFTARAEGLDPATAYVLGYDPAPTPALESAIEVPIGEDGLLEMPAVIPHGVDAQPGDYVVYLGEITTEERLDEVDIEIAQTC